jgi:hypothetical protein
MIQSLLIGAIALLDALPDSIRALLAGLLLAVFLRFFESRIDEREWQLGQAFRKTSLVALMLVPLMVWLFPASRMVVFVEELPTPSDGTAWPWRLVIGCWALGAAIALLSLGHAHFRDRRRSAALPVLDDDRLGERLRHWQRRLGLGRAVTLVQAPDGPRLAGSGDRLELSAEVRHWPAAVCDVLMIQALCHLKRGHVRWHVMSGIVSCLYWPITWVQSLGAHLWRDLEQATETLARACYSDRMGYARAQKQLESRLAGPAPRASDPPGIRPGRAANAYASALFGLFRPAVGPRWPRADLPDAPAADRGVVWTDPYDRVVLFTLQAAFFAFLLTGVTLRERPPEVEADYQLPFELLWQEHLHRNRELLDRVER